MTLAVEVALNPKTTNQKLVSICDSRLYLCLQMQKSPFQKRFLCRLQMLSAWSSPGCRLVKIYWGKKLNLLIEPSPIAQ